MSNKTNIEEDIEYLEQFIGKKKEYKYKPVKTKTMINTRQAIENILADRERLKKELKRKNGDIEYIQRKINKHFIPDTEYRLVQAKANKYVSLVEKIKDTIEEWDKNIKWNNADDHFYCIKILQELLDTES